MDIKGKLDWLFGLVLVAVFIKGAVFANFGLNLILDDGQNYTNGMRILEGEIIYRDFQSFFPPLNDYFIALLLLISKNIVLLRIFTLIPALLLVLVFYKVNMLITGARKLSLLLAALPFIFALRPDLLYIHSLFYFSLYLFWVYLLTRKTKMLLTSAVVFAIASLFRVDTAFVFAFCILVTLFLTMRINTKAKFTSFLQKALIFTAPALIVWILLTTWLVDKDLVGLFIKQVWTVPVAVTSVIRVNLLSLSNLFGIEDLGPRSLNNKFIGWVYAGFIFIVIYSAYLLYINTRKKQKRSDFIILNIILIILLSSPYIFGRMDVGHLLKGGMGFLVLVGYVIAHSKHHWIVKTTRLYIGIALLGFVIISFWWVRFNDTRYNFGTRGILYLNSQYYPRSTRVSGNTILQAVEFLQESESEYVFAVPYFSSLYYLADKKSPIVYDSLINNYMYEPFGENYVIRELRNKKVNRVVYDRYNGPTGENTSMASYYENIDRYLVKNYESLMVTEENLIFMKND